MARIAGVNLPANKRVEIALTYVYGIGKSSAKKIVEEARIDSKRRLNELTDNELTNIRNIVSKNSVEGDLRRENSLSILETINLVNRLSGLSWSNYEHINQARSGDHIWYISNLRKFKKDYPNWKQKYNTKKIIEELIEYQK